MDLWVGTYCTDLFQPTPSSRRVTGLRVGRCGLDAISTNTLLAEGDCVTHEPLAHGLISTNTLLAEGDPNGRGRSTPSADFNQHPPRGG